MSTPISSSNRKAGSSSHCRESARSQTARAAKGAQSEYEKRLSDLQDIVENAEAKAKSSDRNISTLQKEIDRMQAQLKKQKDEAEAYRRQGAVSSEALTNLIPMYLAEMTPQTARTTARAASSEKEDAKKEVLQLKVCPSGLKSGPSPQLTKS